jgi:hypothetical protein
MREERREKMSLNNNTITLIVKLEPTQLTWGYASTSFKKKIKKGLISLI